MLISDKDKDWLTQKYPKLKPTPNEISGEIEFTGNYNSEKNCFRILNDSESNHEVGGITLRGKFRIRIQERENKYLSQLPAVYVEGVDPLPSRHFNQTDKSACLCSPLEEEEFLSQGFSLQLFLQKLVIPFLYGQIFYSNKGYWPWTEYSHGVVGLLESYLKVNDPSKAQDCLNKLSRQDKPGWERVKLALRQKSEIKGHTPCFCPKTDHIRRCHPAAWKGVSKLRQDIKDKNINLDKLC
jgi:hypothetical protein